MEAISAVLTLALLVVVSSVLSRTLLHAVPRPVVQIALGVAVSLVTHFHVQLEPEVFFLLFLPPLLFLDGWRIPTEELYEDRATIVGLALGLVIFTIVGAGLLIDAMIPAIPLPVAFALAAVLSPTDPLAVTAIAARVSVPRRMMRILEGESLLNDATGLVGMRFAVAAALTGRFSLVAATRTFLWVAAGGLAIGVAVTWVVSRLEDWAAARLGDETGAQILTSILIPFAAYIAAERVHCSGILAAVAAGLTMSATSARGRSLAATRIRGTAVWDLVQFVANGVIFVLLGLQIPSITTDAVAWLHETGAHTPLELVGAVVAITIGLAALRFVWVLITFRFTLLHDPAHHPVQRGGAARLIGAFTVAGVRGAVTLAGVLTLPLVMNDGSPFPARAIVVFLAMGVILASLLIASVALPFLLRGMEVPGDPAAVQAEALARVSAARAALGALERAVEAPHADDGTEALRIDAASRLMDLYRARIDQGTLGVRAPGSTRAAAAVERKLRLVALDAEREEIFRRMRAAEIGSAAGRRLVREIDLTEARLQG